MKQLVNLNLLLSFVSVVHEREYLDDFRNILRSFYIEGDTLNVCVDSSMSGSFLGLYGYALNQFFVKVQETSFVRFLNVIMEA